MKIDNNYSIEKDPECFILKYENPTGKVSKKTGKEIVTTSQTYHANLQQALSSYVNKVVEIPESVSKLISQLKGIETSIRNLNVSEN